MRRTVTTVYNVTDLYKIDHGDGYLWPDEDPYVFDGSYGASFRVLLMPQQLPKWSYMSETQRKG